MRGDNVLYLLGVKTISSPVHNTGSWNLLGVLFKISDEDPRLFYMGVPRAPEKKKTGKKTGARRDFLFTPCVI